MAHTVSYIQMLKSLFPRGRAWNNEVTSNMHQFQYAQAEELVRVEEKWEELWTDRDTRYTTNLISEHENDLGLPDECSESGLTLAERRDAAHAKLIQRGGLHKQYYIDLAKQYGYDITITEFQPFWCGMMTSGDPCGDQWVLFVWQVTIDLSSGESVIYFVSGASSSGDPLSKYSLLNTLSCVLEKHKPAHTYIIYALDGYEYSKAFSSLEFDAYPTSTPEYLEGAFDRAYGIAFDVAYGGAFPRREFSNAFNIAA